MTEFRSLYRGRFLELAALGKWEFVQRTNTDMTVAILAVTEDDHLLFVEQMRPPIGGNVLELPAGLVGDDAGQEGEAAENAARRELEEETGHRAGPMCELGTFCSSAGMTNERTILFLATDCRQFGPGGGVEGESIQIHKIPRIKAASWLAERVELKRHLDGKVWTALALAERRRFSCYEADG